MWRVGYFQLKPQFGQVARNVEYVVNRLRDVQADLIVLPELAFTGYFFRDREEVLQLAEPLDDSPTLAVLTALCRGKGMYIVTGFAERRGEKVFNSACLIGPEGVLYTYRKIHLFHNEKHWFDAGEEPFRVIEVQGIRLGIMICFDWIFPESVRCLALQGADIICHPSNLVLSYCQQTMLSRCLENGVYAITANRFGVDRRPHGRLRFTGRSQIVAPRGKLLHRAPAQREEIFIVEIDPLQARNKSFTPTNDLFRDRRPEMYETICQSH